MNKIKLKKIIMIMIMICILMICFSIFAMTYFSSVIYIKSLLAKGEKNINYIKSYKNDEMIDYVKGNVEKMVFSNGKIYYADYSTGELIYINPETKTIELGYVDKETRFSDIIRKDELESQNIEIMKKQKINSDDCIVIRIYENTEKTGNLEYIIKQIYINKSLGVIEKIENYMIGSSGREELTYTKTYSMHTGKAKDEDVSKPNLDEYENYEIQDKRK